MQPPAIATRPVRFLLINPKCPESFWSFRWALTRALPGKRALNPPLGLATLAALCPAHWQVQIIDENIESIPLEPEADLIGICGMAVQFARQRELLAYYRSRGHHVIAGGSYASLCPERYTSLADTVICGEAEYIWPAFCADWERGAASGLYRETGTVDLADSPPPRFDLLELERYTSASVQFSRGCPYRCEFCDIIVMFGRRPRTKRPEQIGLELDELRAAGVRSVFFVDDNLIGHRPKAKALMRYLIDYQARHGYAFQFGTEASLNLAADDELLRLFSAANFAWVFIGIESPDEASLAEAGKVQNTHVDILASVRKIYDHGIDVLGGFIVGFDNDTEAVFEHQRRFIKDAGIQVAMVGLLTALPHTPLHERLRNEGRLRAEAEHADNTGIGTNILPKRMHYRALVDGYQRMYRQLVGDRDIAARIRAKTRHLRRPNYRAEYRPAQRLTIVWRLLWRGIRAGGLGRSMRFLGTLGSAPPRTWPLVISDWIAGLAMSDFVRRRFIAQPAREQHLLARTVRYIEKHCAKCMARGALHLAMAPHGPAAQLAMTLRGEIDGPFFTSVARRLDKLLRRTRFTVRLNVERLTGDQQARFAALLARLAPHGDRLSIRAAAALRPTLAIDSSVFHLVLDER